MAAKKNEKQMVKFMLFADNDKYKGDKFVGVNGKSYLIKRGVEVEMPLEVYEVLKNSNEQMMYAQKVMDDLTMQEIKS